MCEGRFLENDPTPPSTHGPHSRPLNPFLHPRCGAPPLRSFYVPSINLKLASLNLGWILTKQTARRSFQTNSSDVSRLCLNLIRTVKNDYGLRDLLQTDIVVKWKNVKKRMYVNFKKELLNSD